MEATMKKKPKDLALNGHNSDTWAGYCAFATREIAERWHLSRN